MSESKHVKFFLEKEIKRLSMRIGSAQDHIEGVEEYLEESRGELRSMIDAREEVEKHLKTL